MVALLKNEGERPEGIAIGLQREGPGEREKGGRSGTFENEEKATDENNEN